MHNISALVGDDVTLACTVEHAGRNSVRPILSGIVREPERSIYILTIEILDTGNECSFHVP